MRERHSHRTSARFLESAILIAIPMVSHWLIPIASVIPQPWSLVGIGVMILGVPVAGWRHRDGHLGTVPI